MISTSKTPSGLYESASQKFPFKNDSAERVEPHEGHGKVVVSFTKQTVNGL